MTKKSKATSKKDERTGRPAARYRLVNTNWTGFGDWKGERIAKGTEIVVSAEDLKDHSLKNKLDLNFKKVGGVEIEGEAITPITEDEAKEAIN